MDLELIAAGLVVALGVGFALRRQMGTSGALVAATAVLGLVWMLADDWRASRPPEEADVEHRPIQQRGLDYVSSDACRSCHPGEYASWHRSYHRTMTQAATPESVLGDFDAGELSVYGETYRVERRGEEFWVEQHGRWEEGRPERVEKRVVMASGSHHYQLYWLREGDRRKLELFQFVWRVEEQRWMPIDSIFLFPGQQRQLTGEKGRWRERCAHCHTTRPYRDGKDLTVAEFGITCEACHGPGEDHVAANRDPLRRWSRRLGDGGDPTVVNAERLDPVRASQVCGVCHGMVPHRDGPAMEGYLAGTRYFKPGDDLFDTRSLHSSLDSHHFWPDGTIRVSGREYNGMVRSPCYEHGDPERGMMTCLSCHEAHPGQDDPRPLDVWANDMLGVGMDGNAACLQCHEQFESEAKLVGHTRHAPDSTGSRCMDCHMPHVTYGLLKAMRGHRIDSPSLAVELETGRPNACNLCHLDRPLSWTAGYLASWYGQPMPALEVEQRGVAAGALLALRGDAMQRALAAWAMGWEPAVAASGDGWMEPILAQLLEDPYAAVRFIAHRSLRTRPGFEDLEFDSMAAPEARAAVHQEARRRWAALSPDLRTRGDAVLIDAAGRVRAEAFRALLAERDDRYVGLGE